MRSYSEEHGLEFNHLQKDQRIPKVLELAETLMQSLRYVMPIIPVPVIAAVLLRAGDKPMTSLEIVGECDTLIEQMMAKGAAMKAEEKPRPRTLSNSLDLLISRNFLLSRMITTGLIRSIGRSFSTTRIPSNTGGMNKAGSFGSITQLPAANVDARTR